MLGAWGKFSGATGRFPGDLHHFNLYDPKKTNRKAGFYFEAVAEWMIDFDVEGVPVTAWISQCEKCHELRCLVIEPVKEKWTCLKCNRKGTFKKPGEELEKKRDWPGSKNE